MDFYYINSMSDLVEGHFGVREPNTATCTKVTDFKDSVCIVPAISYDKLGYRLGYGKGYYDRFLKKFTIISVGMCYNELITDRLPIGEYDVPVDYIITQDGVFSVRNGG
jgi:5-formyltetrahydrofolate cyclo-ligase